jgi:hypothetical protein
MLKSIAVIIYVVVIIIGITQIPVFFGKNERRIDRWRW